MEPDYSRYPWRYINTLGNVYQDSPVLVALELTTLGLYLILILHSLRRGQLSLLASATISGAINEVVFTSLPMVNNFWHAQAWLMLSARLPAWQPALYGFFLYVACYSADALRNIGWNNRICRAAVAGILGFLLLLPMDAICVRFVVYTWHDSDPLLADRVMGVAAGNGIFAAAFPFCFAILIGSSAKFGSLMACLLSTPTMVLLTLPLNQYIGGGLPTTFSPTALLIGMVTVVFVASWLALPLSSRSVNTKLCRERTMPIVALIYFSVLLAISIFANPSNQKSVGFHQPLSPIGDCMANVTDLSASGHPRRVYLCANDMSKDTSEVLDPTCDPSRNIDQYWYALCGRPFEKDGGSRCWFAIKLVLFSLLGMLGVISCHIRTN